MPKLSVIIPTHQRANILRQCLRHLEAQSVAPDLEVIVVSDGTDDDTASLFRHHAWNVSVKFFEIEKSQQGRARNEGLQHAQGTFVLFIGDDIFLKRDACEKHLQAHERCELEGKNSLRAVLGHTTWDPAAGITPVMRWLESSGWQFGYPKLFAYRKALLPKRIQHTFCYTSHISLPLSVAQEHLFRTDVHLYGWEDIEWGMRLQKSGVRVYYEPDAKALHHHHIDLPSSLTRMQTLGRSAMELSKKVPGFDRLPRGWKLFFYRAAALLPTLAGRHRRAFLSGCSGTM